MGIGLDPPHLRGSCPSLQLNKQRSAGVLLLKPQSCWRDKCGGTEGAGHSCWLPEFRGTHVGLKDWNGRAGLPLLGVWGILQRGREVFGGADGGICLYW